MDQHPDASSQPNLGSQSPADGQPTSDERTMAMLAHLLAIFTWFLGPLIIWLIKKDQSPFVDDQGKEALNFQLTIGIAYVALVVATCLTVGIAAILWPVLGILNIVFCIIACIGANKGERYRYPIAIRLIK